jgi:uncharacterized phage protein gp47/JayE
MTIQAYPTKDEIKAQLLSTYRYLFARAGVTVNVNRWSELNERADAYAARASVAIANGQITSRDLNPLLATGDSLVALASIYGVEPRPASKASGYVIVRVLSPAVTVNIPTGFQGTDASGVKYSTTDTNTPADLASVLVRSVEAGSDTNLAAGSIVTWDSAAIGYLKQQAIVAVGGIDGGANADGNDELRARLLRRLSFPSVGGNWAQVAEWAEASSAAISFAAVYPTARGPSSYDVAIMGDNSDPVLNATVVDAAKARVVAEMPGSANLNLTSVTEQQIDVIINLSAPLPVHAGGAGGGFRDAIPWPSTTEALANTYAEVMVVTPGFHQITVNSGAADAPVAGKRFALWDYAAVDGDGNPTPAFREFSILTVGGAPAAYVLTLDAPTSAEMSFITAGMFCTAACEHMQTYGDLFRAAMGDLGPGEKTIDVDILAWARRQPSPDIERPHALTSRQLSNVSDACSEVADMSFAARLATGTGAAGTATFVSRTTPSVPATVANAPRLLTLKHLSFRRQA